MEDLRCLSELEALSCWPNRMPFFILTAKKNSFLDGESALRFQTWKQPEQEKSSSKGSRAQDVFLMQKYLRDSATRFCNNSYNFSC